VKKPEAAEEHRLALMKRQQLSALICVICGPVLIFSRRRMPVARRLPR
jgi:hypothetical protein